MKAPFLLFALASCLLGMTACQNSRLVEDPVQASTNGGAVSTQKASLPPKAPGAASPSTNKVVPAVSDSPFVPRNSGLRISRVNVPDKLVALTFDDGPHGKLTPHILDILNRYGAKGTFFVLGQNASRFPGILRRAAAEGHEIGSHTWSHVKMTSCGREKLLSEMSRTRDVIAQATGRAPAVMRPPYGAINASTLQTIYSAYGTPAILWDVDTNDWRKPGVGTVIARAVNGARSGSIILVHDIHASTADAIEGIVKGLQARGFRLVTVSELIAAGRRAAGESAPSREAHSATAPAASTSVAEITAPTSPSPTATQIETREEKGLNTATSGQSSVAVASTAGVGNSGERETTSSLPLPENSAPEAEDEAPAPAKPTLPTLRLRTPSLTPTPVSSSEVQEG